MEQTKRLEALSTQVMSYLDTRWDILKLDLTTKSIGLISGLAACLIAAVFGTIAILFAGIGCAKWLNAVLNHPLAGYFLIALGALLCLVLALTFGRNYIRRVVVSMVLANLNNEN